MAFLNHHPTVLPLHVLPFPPCSVVASSSFSSSSPQEVWGIGAPLRKFWRRSADVVKRWKHRNGGAINKSRCHWENIRVSQGFHECYPKNAWFIVENLKTNDLEVPLWQETSLWNKWWWISDIFQTNIGASEKKSKITQKLKKIWAPSL